MSGIIKTGARLLRRAMGGREPGPFVTAVNLRGMILGSETTDLRRGTRITPERVERWLDLAFAPSLKPNAVALCLDSPGGSPAATELIHRAIRQRAEETKTPVFAFVQGIAASGGYWLLCSADEAYCLETSLVGSIGVVMSSFGLKGVLDRLGIERRTFTAGSLKGVLDPFKDLSPEELATVRELLEELHTAFKQVVQERRGPKLAAATSSGNGNGAAGPADLDSSVFSGRVWTGRGALRLGLVDGIGDMTSVLRKKFGQDVRITCVNPTPRGGFPFLPGMDATLAAMTGSSGGGGGRGGVAAFAAAAAARLLDPVNHGPRLMARCPASAEGDSAACYSGGAGTSILGGASATAGRCGGSGSGCDTASAGIRASGSCNAACELGVTNLAASSVASMVAASAEAASASTDSAVARSDASALALVDALHEALAYDESFATFRT